jgi:outer membrane protein assembly factor BamB
MKTSIKDSSAERPDARLTFPFQFPLLCSLLLGLLSGSAAPRSAAASGSESHAARLIASPEQGWPQWRGPRRDGISDETGLLQQWPDGGPALLWKTNGIGAGYAAPIITGGRIYLSGDADDELRILALDLEGNRLWEAKNGSAWKTPYPGSRASCVYSEGRVYHLNAHGRVTCLDAATGKEIWGFETFERFGGRNITWALSEGLLVDGPRLIVTVGGTRALMVALDKKTGETVWTSDPLRLGPSDNPAHERLAEPAGQIDNASYASPVLFALDGRRHIVSSSLRHVFGVDAGSGELLWTRPIPTRYSVVAATPVVIGDGVFMTAPDGDGGRLYRIRNEGAGVGIDTLWRTPLDTCHGGLVHVGDALYGSWYRGKKGWVCLDARTGELRYETDEIAMGSVLYADHRLYCLSQEGEMALINPTPQGFEFKGKFRLVSGRKNDVWTHPVVLDGRLYLRYHDTLYCYDVCASQLFRQ